MKRTLYICDRCGNEATKEVTGLLSRDEHANDRMHLCEGCFHLLIDVQRRFIDGEGAEHADQLARERDEYAEGQRRALREREQAEREGDEAGLRALHAEAERDEARTTIRTLLDDSEQLRADNERLLAIACALSADATADAEPMVDDPDADAQRCRCGHVRGQHNAAGCTARPHRVNADLPACKCTAFYDRAWSSSHTTATRPPCRLVGHSRRADHVRRPGRCADCGGCWYCCSTWTNCPYCTGELIEDITEGAGR